MHNEYYTELINNAKTFIEEWTLCSGYEEAPSTSLHYECRQARNAFKSMERKLHKYHFVDDFYYINLKGYDRKRWELEFDRLYENYLDKMEDWIGDRKRIRQSVEPGIGLNSPDLSLPKSTIKFDMKVVIIVLSMATSLTMFVSFIFEDKTPDPVVKENIN